MISRTSLVAIVLTALAAPASGELAARPDGWTFDEAMSRELTRKAQRGSYFGAFPTTKVDVEAFVAPSGGALFVTRVEAIVPTPQRDVAATHAVFELVEGARRQGAAQIESSAQRADPATEQLEATITWRDPAGVRQIARTIIAGDGTRLVAYIGECVLRGDAAAAVVQVCTAALAKLDTGIAGAQRVPLAIVDAPAETSLSPIPTAPRITEQPRLGDGAGTPMSPMTISPAKREIDRRPLYLGGGIVMLAAVFWWNRRRRDRFDREDAPTPATTEPEPSSSDEDADDLQAAARGAAPKDEP